MAMPIERLRATQVARDIPAFGDRLLRLKVWCGTAPGKQVAVSYFASALSAATEARDRGDIVSANALLIEARKALQRLYPDAPE